MNTMTRVIRPMLTAAALAAAACSPLEEQAGRIDSREAELSISVSAEQQTKGIITDPMLPDGSQIAIAIFNPDGNKYMNKNYSYLLYTAENGEGTQIWKTSKKETKIH